MNLILWLFLTIAGCISFYWILVFILVYFCGKTTDEAKKTISDWGSKIYKFLEELAKSNQPAQVYPVCIGSNGYCIRDDIVNHQFDKLGTYYDIYFYEMAYNYSTNVIVYQFKVYNQINSDFSRQRLLMRCRQIGEKALLQHLHEQGCFDVKIDNFVAVTLQADTLCYFFALNNQGFQEIAELRKNQH